MGKIFINPYAFVSFKEVKERKKISDLDNVKTYSGSFEYTIELKTPLIIPNTSNDHFGSDLNVSKSYGIYSYENLENKNKQDNLYQPIIPGSEIRGCIRSVYEALTNSCYNFNKDNDLYFSERLNPNKTYKPGILLSNGHGEWVLYAASKYTADNYNDDGKNYTLTIDNKIFEMFEKVYTSINENYMFEDLSKTNNGNEEAYLTIGNKRLQNKNCISVFIKKGKPLLTIEKNDSNYKRLIASISSFVDKNLECTYQRYIDALKENKTITIYYEANNSNYRFSPAQIGRVLYNSSLNDKVGISGHCIDSFCPACLMFGNINDDKSVSSRVRFSDAHINNYNYNDSKFIDLISSSPKYSNKYFYANLKDNKLDWDSISCIAGRKFYWHHMPNINNIIEKNKSNKNAKLKSRYYYIDNKTLHDNKFVGKVYFNDVTFDELVMLYKSISLVDDNHCHKLGHGKPFGFGSCNFTISKLNSNDLELKTIKDTVSWTTSLTDRELEYILDFNALDSYVNKNVNVCYPFNNDPLNNPGFKWFVDNKKTSYPQTLPKLINGNNRISPVLKGYIGDQGRNSNKFNKNFGRKHW